MIRLSPGLLYSAQKLIETVSRCPMDRDQYLWSFRTVLVSPAEGVLAISTRCGWIGIDEQLGLNVTEMGRKVQELPTVEGKLRQQIKDYIQAVQPSWAKLLPAGRAEALPFMPPAARQCFYEAALDSVPPPDEVIAWWDDLAAAARGRASDYLAKVGRDGERCSIRYEEGRVGRLPYWHSIESNKTGYDLLSIIAPSDPAELQIEVKASERPIAFATFHVSRNEWKAAQNAERYVFHLWSLGPAGKSLAVLAPHDVAAHVPTEHGAVVVAQPGQDRAKQPAGDAAVAGISYAGECLLHLVQKRHARPHRIEDAQGLPHIGLGLSDQGAVQCSQVKQQGWPSRLIAQGLGETRLPRSRHTEQ